MSNETKSVNYSSLIRYNNKLKPLVITDANVNEDKLTLKYLDNNTKELTLPSGGSSLPTRTVTRVPMFFEIHFQIVQDTSFGMDSQIESKLNIPLDVAKDIIKIYSKSQSKLTPLGFTLVSDVTEGKANNEYDKVFLAAVNCNPKEFYDGLEYDIVVVMETSFGDFNLQTSPFMESINEAREQAGEPTVELPETILAQVITSSSSTMQIYASSGENKNRYIIKAVLGATGFSNGSRSISNGSVSIRPFGASASVSFRLVLDNVEDDPTRVTFTETVLP